MTRAAGSGAYAVMRRYALRALVLATPALVLLLAALRSHGTVRLVSSAVAIAVLLVASAVMAKGDTWERGADNERLVGQALEQLRSEGWLVVHDVPRDYGNIDHIVAGPGGVFTVETKSRRYELPQLNQAWGHARWLSRQTGVRATPLLCIVERDVRPHTRRGVSILPLDQLSGYLRAAHNDPPTQQVADAIARL